jgi:hypothetical protein
VMTWARSASSFTFPKRVWAVEQRVPSSVNSGPGPGS